MFKIMIIAFFTLIAIIFWQIGRYLERKNFNKGVCPNCGTKLRYFDADSQGGRGYTCDKCNYTTWCSYSVDKNYK